MTDPLQENNPHGMVTVDLGYSLGGDGHEPPRWNNGRVYDEHDAFQYIFQPVKTMCRETMFPASQWSDSFTWIGTNTAERLLGKIKFRAKLRNMLTERFILPCGGAL